MGNRTYMEKTLNGTVVEWHRYEYNESNQQISEKLYNGKKTTGKEKNYELIEYLNDVNCEHAEVLVEQNINGKTDTSYIYYLRSGDKWRIRPDLP